MVGGMNLPATAFRYVLKRTKRGADKCTEVIDADGTATTAAVKFENA